MTELINFTTIEKKLLLYSFVVHFAVILFTIPLKEKKCQFGYITCWSPPPIGISQLEGGGGFQQEQTWIKRCALRHIEQLGAIYIRKKTISCTSNNSSIFFKVIKVYKFVRQSCKKINKSKECWIKHYIYTVYYHYFLTMPILQLLALG